jgi:hypothetical protein
MMSRDRKTQMRCFLIFIILTAVLISASSQERPQHHEGCLGSGHDLGEAVDIDALNDKPVSLYGKDPEVTKMVEKTQDIFNHPKDGGPPPVENYGPAGLYRNGKPFTDKKLKENHKDHIHIRFRAPANLQTFQPVTFQRLTNPFER